MQLNLFIIRKTLNLLLTPTLILIIGIIIHSVLTANNLFLLAVKLFIGIFVLIYIPGYCLAVCFQNRVDLRSFGFCLAFGFLYQLLNGFVLWWIGIFFSPLNFTLSVYLLTFIFVLFSTLYLYKNKKIFLFFNLYENNFILLLILLLFMVISLYYQQYIPSPHSDGAAYLDMARNVVKNGIFQSNMLFTKDSYDYVEFTSGRIAHFFCYIAIALFFMLGDISLFSAKVMLIFSGTLCIYLTFFISKELFNRRSAFLAALLEAFSPLLVTHVGLVGGAELPSLLFTQLAVYLILLSQKEQSLFIMVMTGVSMWLSYFSWYFIGVVLLSTLPIFFIHGSLALKCFSLKRLFMFLVLLASLIIDWRIFLTTTFHTFNMPIPSIFPVILLVTFLANRRKKDLVLSRFSVMLLSFYVLIYFFSLSSPFLNPLKEYMSQRFSSPGFSSAVEASGIDLLIEKAMDFKTVSATWDNYWTQSHSFIGSIMIYLAALSISQANKIKNVLALLSFVLLYALFWSLFAQIYTQPRYLLGVSVFYPILAASFIDFIASKIEGSVKNNNVIKLIISRKVIKIELRRVVSLVFSLILISIILIQINTIYDNCLDIAKSWDYRSRFGWAPAIEWIIANTSSNDIIMSRSANYFAWYTERKIAWPPLDENASLSDFINAIRYYKANYLLLDERTYNLYPNIREIYIQPTVFLGAYPVFVSNYAGHKVVIYNVTNIAYGN